MAYQSVGTPRFWVSALQWLNSKGLVKPTGYTSTERLTDENGEAVGTNILNINPVNKNILKVQESALTGYYLSYNLDLNLTNISTSAQLTFPYATLLENNFCMIL